MPFGLWGGVQGHITMYYMGVRIAHGKGQLWEISSPLKSIGIACSRVFIVRRIIRVTLWRETQKLFSELNVLAENAQHKLPMIGLLLPVAFSGNNARWWCRHVCDFRQFRVMQSSS